jgi:predicted methyltransferase
MKVSYIKKLAEEAGFIYAGASEINANPKDTRDYPKGVWTLPPNYAEGDADRAKYAAIGESDRATLRFIKGTGIKAGGTRRIGGAGGG